MRIFQLVNEITINSNLPAVANLQSCDIIHRCFIQSFNKPVQSSAGSSQLIACLRQPSNGFIQSIDRSLQPTTVLSNSAPDSLCPLKDGCRQATDGCNPLIDSLYPLKDGCRQAMDGCNGLMDSFSLLIDCCRQAMV